MKKYIILISLLTNAIYANELYYYNNGKKVYIENNSTKSRFFSLKNNNDSILETKIIFKLKPIFEIEEINQRYGINAKKNNNNIYVATTKSEEDAINLSKDLFEEGYVDFAQPNIKRRLKKF